MATENTINELPLIQGMQTDRLQVDGWASFTHDVTDVASRPNLPADVTAVSVEIPSDTIDNDPVFLGGSNVSAVLNNANRGKMLSRGASIDFDTCILPYMIAASGKTVKVTIFYGK